jgi:hypothetical protein
VVAVWRSSGGPPRPTGCWIGRPGGSPGSRPVTGPGRSCAGCRRACRGKSCWAVAGHAGETDPHGVQDFLARAGWDAGGVREGLRDDVVGALGSDDGVLVVDGTGHVKEGVHGVGVRRRCAGAAGRVEDARVVVYLACAGRGGHAVIDREPRLPKSWTTGLDHRPGPPARTGGPGPASRRRSGSPPGPLSRPACSPAPSRPGCRPAGSPAARSTARTRPAHRAGGPPGRERPGRAGRAPGPRPGLPAAPDAVGDDRSRPARRPRRRSRSPVRGQRADRVDLRRDPSTAHRSDRRTHTRRRSPPGLVAPASSTPVPRQDQPRPPSGLRAVDPATIYGWSTRAPGRVDISSTWLAGAEFRHSWRLIQRGITQSTRNEVRRPRRSLSGTSQAGAGSRCGGLASS